jgi:O-antigen/teichoic acid export membrane protein
LAQQTRFVEGTLWMIALRWAVRGVGLLSTLILARLLTPADFGIVAMSTLVAGLLTAMTNMGTWQLLLRTRNPDRGAYDTAWTITLLQSLLLALAVFLAAYPASLYFKEPRLEAVIQVSAFGGVFAGLNNIGLVMFRRDLNFRMDFVTSLLTKVASVVPILVLVLIYRNYWALVAGRLVGAALEAALSYVLHPYRPRLSLERWREFASYSVWVTPANIAGYLNNKADVFIVGYLGSTSQMGAYNVAAELSQLATGELAQPLMRSVYPNFAKLKDDMAALTSAFAKVLHTVMLLGFGFGFGTAAVADDLIHLLLGDQWTYAVPLLRWLALFGAFAIVLHTLTGHVLIVIHREDLMFKLTWLRLIVFSASLVLAGTYGQVLDIAKAAALSTALLMLGCLMLMPRILPQLSVWALLRSLLGALTAATLMYWAVDLLHMQAIPFRIVRLAMDVTVGATVFSSLTLVLWVARGKPDGIESKVIELVAGRVRALRRVKR